MQTLPGGREFQPNLHERVISAPVVVAKPDLTIDQSRDERLEAMENGGVEGRKEIDLEVGVNQPNLIAMAEVEGQGPIQSRLFGNNADPLYGIRDFNIHAQTMFSRDALEQLDH